MLVHNDAERKTLEVDGRRYHAYMSSKLLYEPVNEQKYGYPKYLPPPDLTIMLQRHFYDVCWCLLMQSIRQWRRMVDTTTHTCV
jgi:hypothetical protein